MFHSSTALSAAATPAQVLEAALRPQQRPAAHTLLRPSLLIAGATGTLGSEVLRRFAGSSAYSSTRVLAREPITAGLRQVHIELVPGDSPAAWPVSSRAIHTAVVLLEPPRLYYGRERALWTPEPGQLPALAAWLRRCGVDTLAIVVPHAQGRMPEALKRGLASLDEQSVAGLGFRRLLFVRASRPAEAIGALAFLDKLAARMLSIFSYMVPSTEQPVRPARIAEFVQAALQLLPAGTHVVPPEVLWRASQSRDMDEVILAWLGSNNG